MQRINYKETIQLENKINELLLINIDDKLIQTRESDCLKITGEITISGEVMCDNKTQFNHPIGVDIMLSNEQLMDNDIIITIDDFNYSIDNNLILIELIMKIDGLKEIEAYFPSQENQENIQIEEREELPIAKEAIEENQSNYDDNTKELNTANENVYLTQSTDIVETKEEYLPQTQATEKETNYSLLNRIFKKREIKKETCFFIHVIKNETTYEEISDIYKIDINAIKSVNKDEELYKGKLIFIPKK